MTAKKQRTVFVLIALAVIAVVLAAHVVSKYVFLAPACYSDSRALSDEENYRIKKTVLTAIKDRANLTQSDIYYPSDGGIIVQLDTASVGEKRLFSFINTDFMESVTEIAEGEYRGAVQTYFTEQSEDCRYEFEVKLTDDGWKITSFGLDS